MRFEILPCLAEIFWKIKSKRYVWSCSWHFLLNVSKQLGSRIQHVQIFAQWNVLMPNLSKICSLIFSDRFYWKKRRKIMKIWLKCTKLQLVWVLSSIPQNCLHFVKKESWWSNPSVLNFVVLHNYPFKMFFCDTTIPWEKLFPGLAFRFQTSAPWFNAWDSWKFPEQEDSLKK